MGTTSRRPCRTHGAMRAGGSALALALLASVPGCGGDDSVSPPPPPPPAPTPGISVTLAAASTDLVAGTSGTTAVTISRTGGFSGPVTLGVTGLPTGVTASATPSTVAAGANTALLTWTVGSTTSTGNHGVTVRATAAGVPEATASFALRVLEPEDPPAGDATIGTGGGTLAVDRPGDPLHGLALTIPAGAFGESHRFIVRETDQTGIPQPDGVRFVSPVVSLETTASSYTTEAPMSIRVPVAFARDEWPVALLFDRGTGAFISLPTVPFDTTSVVVATRHLNGAILGDGAAATFDGIARQETNAAIQLVIGAVHLDDLAGDLDSGFRPGIDDWEFDHVVSHFSDASRYYNVFPVLAAWYYHRFKAGGGPLNGRFQEADGIELSNAQGLRAGGLLDPGFSVIVEYNKALAFAATQAGISLDSVQVLSIKAGLYTTNLPQVLYADSPTGDVAAFLVYRTRGNDFDVSLGTSASGVNAPRTLSLENGRLSAFTWGPRDPDSGSHRTSTTSGGYLVSGATATLPASWLDDLWGDILAGTAGDGIFPEWEIVTTDDGTVGDTLWVADDSTRVWIECASCAHGYPPGPGVAAQGNVAGAHLHLREGSTWRPLGTAVRGNGLPLTDDDDGKVLGLAIFEAGPDGSTSAYLDWTEVVISTRRLKVTPDSSSVVPDSVFTLTATWDGAAPPNPTWEWELGDGRTEVTETNSIEISYPGVSGNAERTYEVKVRLKSGSTPFASGKASVTVEGVGSWVGEVTVSMVSIAGTYTFRTTELRLSPGEEGSGPKRWNVVEGQTAFSFTPSGVHACALSAPAQERPVGTGWLEILGTEVLAYRAYGTMEPWAVTVTADCGSDGSYEAVLSFDHWMGTGRDETGALIWEISSNRNVLEGTHFFASGKEGEGWEYTWRFER